MGNRDFKAASGKSSRHFPFALEGATSRFVFRSHGNISAVCA
jgi:hypothetical protein